MVLAIFWLFNSNTIAAENQSHLTHNHSIVTKNVNLSKQPLKLNKNNVTRNKKVSKKILLLGDSLSASYGMATELGWVHLLNNKLQDSQVNYQILNASISGNTSAEGLARLPKLLDKANISALIIELGGNDGLRGYSPKLMKKNLTKMITMAKAKGLKVAVINIKIPPNYGARYTRMFEQVYQDVAKEQQISLLPFFMEQIANNKQLMQADNIHPNQQAQAIIADIVYQQLLTFLAINSQVKDKT